MRIYAISSLQELFLLPYIICCCKLRITAERIFDFLFKKKDKKG